MLTHTRHTSAVRALFIILCLLLPLVLAACTQEPGPDEVAFLPRSTISIATGNDIDLMQNPNTYAHDVYPMDEFEQLLLAAGIDKAQLRRVTLFANGYSPAMVVEAPGVSDAFSRLRENGSTVQQVNGIDLIEIPSPSELPDAEPWAWVMITGDRLAIGGMSAIEELIAVEQEDMPNLYDGRPELQPMLRAFAGDESAVMVIMPEQTASAEDAVGPIVQRVLSGSMGRMAGIFGSMRGMATSGAHYEDGCTMELGFQFADQGSAVLAQGASTLLIGAMTLDDSSWTHPDTSHVSRDGSLVHIEMGWELEDCLRAMERDGVEIPSLNAGGESDANTSEGAAADCGTAVVTSTSGVNVRAQPSTDSPVVTQLAYNTSVTMRCVSIQDGNEYTWVPIATAAGNGWIAGELLSLDTAP